MKPAISVILLTTLIGAGQGLFLAWFSAELFALLSILPPQRGGGIAAAGLSLVLLVAGLIASFFHLGHPERAWRAAAMWRTSWLSREVILLPLTMALIAVYAWLPQAGLNSAVFILGNGKVVTLSTLVGLAALFSVLALFICTAMIYTCLKFLRQWHSPLTVLNFLLMGSASGFTLAATQASILERGPVDYFVGAAMLLTLLALATRYASLSRNRRLRSPSSLQSAIGVHHPTIRQLAQGAMGGSFNTRAFIHGYGPQIVRLARRFFLLAGFIAPLVLLAMYQQSAALFCSLAFVLQLLGLLAERWYFFIEAEHPQNVYYQMIS